MKNDFLQYKKFIIRFKDSQMKKGGIIII